MISEKKVIVVLPAYNAAKTLRATLADIPRDFVDEILLVDDASQDDTVAIAEKLGIITIRHERNTGYGGNQKTSYREALKRGADIVIMVHPDHQYDPKYIPQLIKPLKDKKCDAVFGSRMMIGGAALKGGMPRWKYMANIFLTKLENMVLGLRLTEYHSGFRAYSRDVMVNIPWQLNSDKFVFDTEIIVQMKIHGFKIREIPISTRYFKEASTIGLMSSIKYGLAILVVLGKYIIQRSKLKRYVQFS